MTQQSSRSLVLQSLSTIHDASVLHRDLAARNVLLAKDSLKVGDFGKSSVVTEAQLESKRETVRTVTVATRR